MIRKHLRSYHYAFSGVWLALRTEPNMLIHLTASVAVIITNYVLGVRRSEWITTITLMGVVWMAELFNTAIEKLANRVTTDHDPMIGQVKDLASGAVLIVCVAAAICAVVIYLPYFI